MSTAKPKVVILGTGWSGFNLARSLDKTVVDVTVVSPSNHFLFTPLLPSTAVGTLEFRAIQEPIRTIPGVMYDAAKAHSVDFDQKVLTCQSRFKDKDFYQIQYDHLVIACGSKTNTFNTPGVAERELAGTGEVCFLKHLYHAKMIRNRVLECFERASVPGILPAERDRLLSFVVVGGGPTSCEFTGELHDFVISDVACWYPSLKPHITIHLLEAGSSLLGSFDESLRRYLEKSLLKRKIDVRTGAAVTEVSQKPLAEGWLNPELYCALSDGSEIPFGCMVWSAGLQPVNFVRELELPKGPGGRLAVDAYMRVQGQGSDVFALGDCAADAEEPMLPLAKVAEQQAKYLAASINEVYSKHPESTPKEGFKYSDIGSMVSIGGNQGMLDMTTVLHKNAKLSGFLAFLSWRVAYWGKSVSWANKLLIPMYWFKSKVFGRDISMF